MRCCLMSLLLHVLSDMLQNSQLLSHIHICPKPKVKLGPTKIFHPAPPSSLDIAIATNPNQFGHTDGISVSPRWACKLCVSYCNYLGLTEISKPGSTNSQHKRHKVYTSLGHRCGVITYSSVVVVDCLLG